jgi:O-antigen/teichoic acid export membrane protein
MGYEVASLLSTLLAFVLLSRTLGTEGYGDYASLYALIAPLITLAGSGMTLALLQHAIRDGEPLGPTARSCLSLALLIGLGLTVVGTGATQWILHLELSLVAITTLLLVEFVITPAMHIAAATVQIGTGFVGAAQIRLVFIVARTVILIGLAVTDELTLTNLGVLSAVVGAVLVMAILPRVGRRYDFAFFPGHMFRRHLKSNVIYSTAISASALSNDGDKVVMAANGLRVETGLYAAAYRMVTFAMLPVASVVTAAHGRFLEHEEGVKGQHLKRASKFGIVSLGYGVVSAVGLFLVAPILPLIVGEDFEGSVQMVRWLAPVCLVRSLSIFSLNGLMGLGHHVLRTSLILGNACIAMVIYLVLIPRYGWEGAAVGTLLGESIEVASTWTALVICQRRADRAIDAAAAASAATPDEPAGDPDPRADDREPIPGVDGLPPRDGAAELRAARSAVADADPGGAEDPPHAPEDL